VRPRFHALPALTTAEVADVLATIVPRVLDWLARHGDGEEDAADQWVETTPVLAGLAAAPVQGVAALGAAAGQRAQRFGRIAAASGASPLAACQARQDGFDLHAALRVRAGRRERLERVCRYVLRPPVAQDRVTVTSEGQVRLALRHAWSDGTTHLGFDPVAFLERLAVLVPRPRVNLILYHGVLAPRAVGRSAIVPRTRSPVDEGHARAGNGWRWAALMRRAFGFDVLACGCDGRLRLIALVEPGAVCARILRHLGVPTEVPAARPPRAPPPVSDADDPSAPGLPEFDS
jgi:hypothetical protein